MVTRSNALNATLSPEHVKMVSELGKMAQPGAAAGFDRALRALATTGDVRYAAAEGVKEFILSDAGRAMGAKAAQVALPAFDTLLRNAGPMGTRYTKLLSMAGDPATHKLVATQLTKLAGPEFGKVLTRFTSSTLNGLSKNGLQGGFNAITRAAPKAAAAITKLGGFGKLLGILGKFSKALPFVGLAIGIVNLIKTFSDKNASGWQKLMALTDFASGLIGTLVPGSGAITTAVSMGANVASSFG